MHYNLDRQQLSQLQQLCPTETPLPSTYNACSNGTHVGVRRALTLQHTTQIKHATQI
jgi:hypothetical protein